MRMTFMIPSLQDIDKSWYPFHFDDCFQTKKFRLVVVDCAGSMQKAELSIP